MKTVITSLALTILLLTGSALAQGPAYPYSVNLSFTASTGTVTGYNMYRAPYTTVCGTFAKLNTTPFTTTTYVDSNPPQGQYCYEATALDGSSESGPSNVVSDLVIPPPPPTGLGETVSQNHVDFQWTQSTGTQLASNAIDCGTASGGPYQQVWTGALSTTHTLTFPNGTKYCVVTVTGGSSSAQSGGSNQVKVTVN
jgi:hypothetical protein